MPILTNLKHELFAQGLAQGLSNRAAFAPAGYKPSDSTASHLANSDKVKARVDELISRWGMPEHPACS
jgi:phage terminase small subunit